MPQSVKISVILTIQEPAIHLIRCLDSILLQTLPNIEVICLYSNLTQASFNLLKRYTEFDNRLSLIQSEQTTKEQLYIQGIQKAKGQFLFFTEAAIFLDPDMLRKMLKKAQSEHSDIVICGHGVFDYRQELVTKKIIPSKEFRHKSPFSPQDAGNDLFQLCKPVAWNKLIRTNTIKKFLTGMDETTLPNADILLSCFPLMKAKKISVLGETLVYAEKALHSEPYIQLEVFLNTITSFYNKNKKMILKGKYLTPLAAFCLSRIRHLLDKIPTDQKTEALISIEEKLPINIFEQLFPNNGIKISVIIPVYNASDFLSTCLDSALNQTLKDIEIICVDDGSSDNSLRILRQYARQDKRIRVLHQTNQGQAIARNKAMGIAKGKYIQFLDADDCLEKNACECFYLYSEIHKLDMLLLTSKEFYRYSDTAFRSPHHSLRLIPDKFRSTFSAAHISDILPKLDVSAALSFYKKDFLKTKKINWINKKTAYEDIPFFTTAVLKARRIGAFKFPLYRRRLHCESTTHQIKDNFNEYVESLKLTLRVVKKLTTSKMVASYADVFLSQLFGYFQTFDPKNKLKASPFLYNFCTTLQHDYCISLPQDIFDWCIDYLRNGDENEKLLFMLSVIKLKLMKRKYQLNLITWQRKPSFSLSILGIPVLYTKTSQYSISKKKGIHQKTFLKCLGIKLWKIRDSWTPIKKSKKRA